MSPSSGETRKLEFRILKFSFFQSFSVLTDCRNNRKSICKHCKALGKIDTVKLLVSPEEVGAAPSPPPTH